MIKRPYSYCFHGRYTVYRYVHPSSMNIINLCGAHDRARALSWSYNLPTTTPHIVRGLPCMADDDDFCCCVEWRTSTTLHYYNPHTLIISSRTFLPISVIVRVTRRNGITSCYRGINNKDQPLGPHPTTPSRMSDTMAVTSTTIRTNKNDDDNYNNNGDNDGDKHRRTIIVLWDDEWEKYW